MPFHHRYYRSEADYGKMRALLAEAMRINGAPVYLTAGELDWWRCVNQGKYPLRNVRLWLDETERLVGFAWAIENGVDMFSHPARHAVEKEMIAWAEANLAAQPRGEGEGERRLRAWCLTRDTARRTMLARLGYLHLGAKYWSFFHRRLDQPLPAVKLPEGFAVREVDFPTEAAARVELHRQVFIPSSFTTAKYKTLQKYPAYRHSLDVAAVAPTGELTAFCLGWLDEVNWHGALEPVGTHPEFRGRGLASAVCMEVLQRMKDAGAHSASVFCHWEEEAPQRLYRSLGFTELDRVEAWEKAV